MSPEELDIAFQEAVEIINQHTDPFPADVLLRLYAYYKRATNEQHSWTSGSHPLITAFKTNALFQTRGLTAVDAKRYYIEAVEQYLKTKK